MICDPDQKLYRQFEILPAADRDELKGGDAPKKSARAVEMGLVHGEYEGNELQLPAAVLVDGEMTVRYAHYGTNAADTPPVEEIVRLIKEL